MSVRDPLGNVQRQGVDFFAATVSSQAEANVKIFAWTHHHAFREDLDNRRCLDVLNRFEPNIHRLDFGRRKGRAFEVSNQGRRECRRFTRGGTAGKRGSGHCSRVTRIPQLDARGQSLVTKGATHRVVARLGKDSRPAAAAASDAEYREK